MPGLIGLFFTNPFLFLLIAAALVVAVTAHEFAHAYVADRLGDPTPRIQRRITLNPLAHLDPLGTLALLFIGFGWGKPVQFDPFNLQNPKRDTALISLAGPATNFLLVLLIAILLRISHIGLIPFNSIINLIAYPFVTLNLGLALFNLIPIHPLDGGKILVGILPTKDSVEADSFLKRYGMIMLLFILLPIYNGQSFVSYVLGPTIDFLTKLFIPNSPLVI